ncbi:uncharacterized protein DUF2029 [Stackebrandtia albiflava]|uniref:Uncharacterized protein DUF2029 n=1 Tax=Stackebrandtia albiflava TaxID=406432 RepID=A0A562VCJ5_9ACTN|nr:glycosyltransferase 87 family protein [Stackebrandtia albiflava]TWJ15613.1 uncharacterized protein DUF2029 [Stackebrandtia albiflava]
MSAPAAVRPRHLGMTTGLAIGWLLAVMVARFWYDFGDLRQYHAAIVDWWSGGPLYAQHAPGQGFNLPPLAAVALTPVLIWPVPVAVAISTGLSLTALLYCVRHTFRRIAVEAGRPGRWWYAAAAVAALALEPVRQTLGLGQLSLVLLALVLADLALARRGHPAAGIGIGLATAVQFGFGLFGVYLLATRRWRAGLTAIATVVTTWVAAFLAMPQTMGEYLSHVLFEPDRTGHFSSFGNQALSGLIARLYESDSAPAVTWLGFALFAAVWGLAHARDTYFHGDEAAAIATVGLTGVLVSPISWSHQLVWVIPAMAVLTRWAFVSPPPLRQRRMLDRPVNRRIVTAALWLWFAISPIWWPALPGLGRWGDGAVRLLTDNGFVLATILLIALLPRAAHWTSPTIPVARRPRAVVG